VGYLVLVPPLDLGAEPEPWTTRTEIEDRPWHVRPPALVLADGVSMGEAQDPGDIVGVDELIKQDSSSHIASLHRLADGSRRLGRLPVHAGV
jgi:hypothetical protein